MRGVVVFDPAAFKLSHPEFADVDDAVLNTYFRMACLLLDNSPKSIVKNLDERQALLELLVCHIATLKKMGNGVVGILAGATEGSVSVSYSTLANPKWYQLTTCGAMYWAATAKYRQGVRWFSG